VTKDVDCRVFEDQLDALVARRLPEEGLRQLRLHARTCPDCAMLLRVQEHLAQPGLEDLEAAVPEEMVTSMWPTVEAAVGRGARPGAAVAREPAERAGQGASESPVRPLTGGRWLMPALAAASVVLLLSTGFLAAELRSTRNQVRHMAEQADRLSVWVAAVGNGANLVERTAKLGEGRSGHRRALSLAFLGQDDIRLEALVSLLRNLPEDEVLFRTSQLRSLARTPAPPSPELREFLSLLERAAGEMGAAGQTDAAGEVRAGDLAEWLATSGFPADLALPKSPIMEIFS